MPVDSFPSERRNQPQSLKGPKLEPQKFAVPTSSTQQIKFRLSGFEEMPKFDSVGPYPPSSTRSGLRTSKVPIMPKPGRTIPKFGVEQVAAAMEKTVPPPPPTPASTSTSKKATAISRGSLLNRFDNAVDTAKTHNKSAVLKNKLRSDLDNRLKKELGGSEANLDSLGRKSRSDDPLAKEIDSIQKIGAKMDNIMKGWMPEEELEKRIRGNSIGGGVPKALKTDRKALLPARSIGKGSISSHRHSDSKLKVISDGFRATLNPFASRDPRELIRTPSDDIIDNLNHRHMESLQQNSVATKKSAPLKAPRGGGKSNGTSTSDLQGLMDFRTLLEKQSELQKRLNNPGGKLADHIENEDYSTSKSTGIISGSEVVSSLTESTKSLDAAANIAQRLGTLMSRVASQSAQKASQKELAASKFPEIPSPRSRFLPIEELTRRASLLKGVAQEAHRSLQGMHSVGVGGETPRNPGSILSSTWNKDSAMGGGIPNSHKKKSATITSKAGQTDRGMSTQTDRVEELTKSPSVNFEFVKDMSYTDQLILKKLRGLKASWSEDAEGDAKQDEPQGTGDQFISHGTLAAAIASSRK